jgi:hypothetical protein
MKRLQSIKLATAFALMGAFAFSATHPAFAVQFAITTCTLAAPTPCVGGTNTSTGPGIQGISNLGFGNVGQTKFNSTSTSNGKAGILGQDLSTSGTNDEGVRGTSVRGLGVHGISSSRAGVRGDGTSSQGVFGSSSSNAGTQGVSVTGPGVVGQSTSTTGSGNGGTFTALGHGNGIQVNANQNGIAGLFNSQQGTGIFSFANTSGFGIDASSATSVGVFGIGTTGGEFEDRSGTTTGSVLFLNGFGSKLFRANNATGTDVFTLFDSGQINASGPAFFGNTTVGTGTAGLADSVGVQGSIGGTLVFPKAGVQGNNTGDAGSVAIRANGFGGRLFVGNNSAASDVFVVDDSGNLFVAGNVSAHSYSVHGAPTTLQATRTGGQVTTYSSQASAPTIEDIGEARLVGGTAYVPLKPGFGSAIDRNQPYFIFITAQGNTRGPINVVQKDAKGFTVREVGGASSVAFDYRIVAKPYVAHTGMPSELQTVTGPKKQFVAPVIPKTTKRSNALSVPKTIH